MSRKELSLVENNRVKQTLLVDVPLSKTSINNISTIGEKLDKSRQIFLPLDQPQVFHKEINLRQQNTKNCDSREDFKEQQPKIETQYVQLGTFEAKILEIKEKHRLTDDMPSITEHNSVSEVQSQYRSNSSESRRLRASIISNKSTHSYQPHSPRKKTNINRSS